MLIYHREMSVQHLWIGTWYVYLPYNFSFFWYLTMKGGISGCFFTILSLALLSENLIFFRLISIRDSANQSKTKLKSCQHQLQKKLNLPKFIKLLIRRQLLRVASSLNIQLDKELSHKLDCVVK